MYLDAEGITLQTKDEAKSHVQLGKAEFVPLTGNEGGYVNADVGGYQILLNYRGPREYFQTVSIADILENRISPDLMRDRIVLIGATGQSANDLFFTPYSQSRQKSQNIISSPEQTPGVIIHANIASQIISGATEGRPLIKVLTDPVEWLWMFLWGVINGSLGLWFGRLRSQQWLVFRFFTLFLTGVTLTGVCYIAFLGSWWLPVVPSLLVVVGSAIALPVVTSVSLEKIQFYRTLELMIEAYSENPADGRFAVEIFIRSAPKPKVAMQALNRITIKTLNSCQTPEDIAAIYYRLAWIPQPFQNNINSVLTHFLEISQSVEIALDTPSPEQQQELLNQSIARLHRLQKSLTFSKNSQAKTFRQISRHWISILNRLVTRAYNR